MLLGEIAERAGAAHGWPHAHLEVTPSASFAPQLARAVVSTLELLESAPRHGRLRVTETVLRAQLPGVVGAAVHLARQPQGDGDPTLATADLLRALAERLMARNTGVVLTIDEAQLADRDEMTRFAAALQEATGKDWPLVVVLAGLRSLAITAQCPATSSVPSGTSSDHGSGGNAAGARTACSRRRTAV